MGLCIAMGIIVAFTSSAIVFSNKEKNYIADVERLIFWQNCAISFFSIGLFIVIRDKPTHLPSSVAEKKVERENLCLVIAEAFKEKSYLLLCIVYGIIYGCYISLPIELSPIFSYYKKPDGTEAYSTFVISIYGMTTSIVGVLTAIVSAIFLQKYQRFSLSLKLICGITCITSATSFVTVPMGNVWYTGISVIILGIGLVPINPVGMNFASELTFPLPPATTNGVLLMTGHTAGCVISLIGTPLC